MGRRVSHGASAGAGTGRNSRYLPAAAELVAVEPDAKALRYRSARGRDVGSVAVAPGEALPLPDGSFDSALTTLVLCSVEDPDRVAAELRRVLRSGGRLYGVDHVISASPWAARVQHRLAPFWYRRSRGCHIDRTSVATLRRAGFRVEVLGRRLAGITVRYVAEVPGDV